MTIVISDVSGPLIYCRDLLIDRIFELMSVACRIKIILLREYKLIKMIIRRFGSILRSNRYLLLLISYLDLISGYVDGGTTLGTYTFVLADENGNVVDAYWNVIDPATGQLAQ